MSSQFPRRTAFWSVLDPPARTELLRLGEERSYAPREVLLHQHEESEHVLVLRRGHVKVTAASHLGYEAVLGIRDPGDLLGEQACLEGRPRSATVTALTDASALIVPARAFTAAQRSMPTIATGVQSVLSARLREADRYRTAVGAGSVQARLASLLLDLAERYGAPLGSGETVVRLPLSQDDLSGLVLSSRRTVSRVLEQWRRQGWVRTGRHRLVIGDPDALKRTAEDHPPRAESA
ncbi:helix-turn-helix domain-containing protein [Streptomyces sp. TRM43335]|uniref:Helix-turn-helix domain-containing protein n=1 Tax=Streptomyces taklimakanensis TaxID=2569853 RepID=A0A6G2BAY2_9ACTN|nr:Crp/Fnr family transcriptional regulator [Streptomyces taklimakanensis]MTE19435.1 helix-turn-helix domain-containing protein [Streptomyces taklimakanensis]